MRGSNLADPALADHSQFSAFPAFVGHEGQCAILDIAFFIERDVAGLRGGEGHIYMPMMLTAAGPMMTRNRHGRMNIISGNMIFTGTC